MTANGIKLLLVGDDLSLAGSIGFQVLHAWTLEEAVLQLRTRYVDAILVNLKRSEAEQIGAIQDLHELDSSTAIIVLNDSEDTSFALNAVHHGAQDVIRASKVHADTLRRTIQISIERKRLEQYRILHSREDELTGLANRLLMEERFERAIARADRQATLVALVAIELDQPEAFLGFHDHHHFDRLMPLIAERLMREIRETDTLARSRDAGFTWLVEGLAAINDISTLVDRLPRVLADPFQLDQRDVQVTVSIGVVVYPFHGRNFSALSKMAEAAMLDVSILNGDGLLMPPLPSLAEKSRPVSVAV
ncbi:MAG: diguanylate cyclase domain-containing protein [Geminicoccaceae bacterium]